MKKFYLLFFTLVLSIFLTTSLQAQFFIQDCLENIEVSASLDLCSRNLNFDDPSCFGCLAIPGIYFTYEFSGATVDTTTVSQAQFNVGITDVIAILTQFGDPTIYLDTCQFTVTVTDDQSPVAICKDITVQLDASGVQSIAHDSINDGSWDNCNFIMESSQIDFSCSDVGDVPVTLTVTDTGLNVDQCVATVTVIDTVNPNVIVVAPFNLYLEVDGTATIDTSDINDGSSDVCGIDTMWLSEYNFDCDDVCMNSCAVPPPSPPSFSTLKSAMAPPAAGSCPVVWLYVQDVNGNLDSLSTTLTVWDTIPPDAVCQDITVNLSDVENAGSYTLTTDTIDNGSTDSCGIESMWLDMYTLDCDTVCANMEGAILGAVCPTVTLTVADYNCNTSTCTSTVTVVDNNAPHTMCRDTTVYLDSLGNGELTAMYEYDSIPFINNNSWDNCMIDTMWLDIYDFDCDDIEQLIPTHTITLTAKDIHGNTSSCTSTVIVKDTLAPAVECQAVTIYLNDEIDGYAKIVADDTDLMNTDLDNNNVLWNFWDNCSSDVSFMLSKDSFECADICLGTDCNMVELTATDEEGNTSTCMASVSVQDSFPPQVLTHDDTLYLDVNGMAILDPADIDDGSWDNCDIDSMWVDKDTFICDSVGVHTVWLTAIDESGNSAMNTAQVTILDTMAPEVMCSPLTVYLYEVGEYVLNDQDIMNMSAGTVDNCTAYEDLIIEIEDKSFECIHVFDEMVPVTVYATDVSGNTGMCYTYVVVKDDIPPVMKCKDVVDVYLDDTGNASIYPILLNDGDDIIKPDWARTYNHLAGGSYDACGIDSAWVSLPLLTCGDVGTIEVELFMIDPSLNQSTCTSMVIVHDTLPPTIMPIADVELDVDPGVCETLIDYPAVVVDDNCEVVPLLTAGLGADGMFPLGTTTETWLATDDEGNTATVTFDVIITTTNDAPTIDAVDDVVAEEDADPITVALSGISYGSDCEEQDVTAYVTGTNAALVTPVLTYTNGDATGSLELTIAPDMNGTAEISITVEDNEGGSTVEVFMVTVNPVNDAPFVVSPVADQSVNASHVLKVPISQALGDIFDDIDDDMLTLDVMMEDGSDLPAWATLSGDTIVCEPTITDTGCVNIVVTATDAGGLTASDTFEICVEGYSVSISELGENQFEVTMYPNPTRGKVNLDITSGIYNVQLAVMDITGKVIIRKQFSAAENITFDMSGKVSGMYFVQLDFDGKQIIKKLVVDRK